MNKIPHPDEQPTMKLWPEVGEALRLKRSATYAAAQRGQIPTIRIGGKVLVPTACLRRMLQLDQAEDVEDLRFAGVPPMALDPAVIPRQAEQSRLEARGST